MSEHCNIHIQNSNKYCPICLKELDNVGWTMSGHWKLSKYSKDSILSKSCTRCWDDFQEKFPSGELGVGCRGYLPLEFGIVCEVSTAAQGERYNSKQKTTIYDSKPPSKCLKE